MATLRIKLEARYWNYVSQEWSDWDPYYAYIDQDHIAQIMYYGNWQIMELKDEKNKTQIRRVKE